MSGGQDYAFARACPSCAAQMQANSLICPRCGGFPEVERARHAATDLINRGFGRFRGGVRSRRISRSVLLWVLALTPLLIGPPLIALVLVAVIARRERASLTPGQTLNLAAVVLASLANLGLSAWADVQLAGDAVRYAIAVKRYFNEWVKELLTIRVVPGGGGFPHGGGGSGRSA